MTKEQGEKIINLLEQILERLDYIDSNTGDLSYVKSNTDDIKDAVNRISGNL